MEVAIAEPLYGQQIWNLAKLKYAERLLKKGFTAEQVGSKLSLSQSQIEELKFDAESEGIGKAIVPYSEWRKNAAEEIERKIIKITSGHLGAVDRLMPEALIDPETMGTVKDASQIAHLWLRKGEESSSGPRTINFNVLANAQPAPPGDGTQKVIEIESEETVGEELPAKVDVDKAKSDDDPE